ncbi:MAG: nitrilase-related carbon-nitrogen hydrolase [Geminicoccaceae bacterium]
MTASSLRLAVAGGPAPAHARDALAWAERRMSDAAAARAELLVLPQQTFGGCGEEEALLSDDPVLRTLAQAAARHGVATAFGYVEQCTGRRHHAVQLVDARGLALANYRAAHLAAEATTAGLSAGNWFNQVRLGGLAVGLLADHDLLAPEPARALALAGATILAVAADIAGLPPEIVTALLRARAFENGCGLVFANRAAEPASAILGPDGTLLAGTVDGIAVADVPQVRPAEAASRLAARRPLLYQRLSSPHAQDRAPRD